MITIPTIIEGSASCPTNDSYKTSEGVIPSTNVYIRRKPDVELEKMNGAKLTKTEGARKKWQLISLQLQSSSCSSINIQKDQF